MMPSSFRLNRRIATKWGRPLVASGTLEPSGMTVIYANTLLTTDYSFRNGSEGGTFTNGVGNLAQWYAGAGYPGAPENGPPGLGNGGGLYRDMLVSAYPGFVGTYPTIAYLRIKIAPSSLYQWHGSFSKIGWLGSIGEVADPHACSNPGCAFVIGAFGVNGYLAAIQQFKQTRNLVSGTVIPKGSLSTIEVVAIGNTADISNGILRLYLNGTLVGEWTDVLFSSPGQPGKISGTRLDPYWGGAGDTVSANMSMLYTETYLSGKTFV